MNGSTLNSVVGNLGLCEAASKDAARAVKLDKNGVPIDRNDWTEADWLDLHRTIKRLQRRIAARHR